MNAAKEEADDDDDANNNGLRRRRRNRTNKTDDDYDEETDGKQRQKMTFTRDDDDDDDDAEDNNNNNSKDDDDEFVLSNVRPNRIPAKEEEEEEEASIKERARTLKRRLQYEVLEEQRWREALKSDDISLKRGRIGKTYVQRRVQTHDFVRAKRGSGRSASTSAVCGSHTSSQNGRRMRGCATSEHILPPLKGRQQKAMTITGDFIRAAKPKTFATLKVVLDAVAERYEIDQEKTVWTKTLWKYVSQEWDFRYYEMNDGLSLIHI